MAINPNDITTVRVGELPNGTSELTSKMAIENGTDLYKITFQDLVTFMNINASAIQYEVKDLWVNQAYIDNNFTETGLGKNLMLGYAICNGNNGTPPMAGLVSIGYGGGYNVIGGFGGSKDAVVVSHTHTTTPNTAIDFGSGITNVQRAIAQTAGGGQAIDVGIVSAGESGTNKNMQPYIILLKVMKL